MSIRKRYFVVFIVLFFLEVFIALFVRDNFVRPYIGDTLVVIVLYALVRCFIPYKLKNGVLPLLIFLFSVVIEVFQYFNIVQLLGFENNRFLSTVIGTVFDIKDIICYGIGCALIFLFEIRIRKKS